MNVFLHLPAITGIWGLALFMPLALQGASPIKVVTFGDSTTAPRNNVDVYTDQLRRNFAARSIPVELVNKGVGGNDTAMAAQRFEKDVLAEKPQIVVIQFGINDSTVDVWKAPPRTQPRVSEDQFEQNLRHFVEEIRTSGGEVILMTPNPVRWTDQLRKLYGKEPYDPEDEAGFSRILIRYADIVRKLAAEYHVPLVDVFALYDSWEKENGLPCAKLLLDGMHPSSKGQTLVADALEPELLRKIEAARQASRKTSPAVP